VSDTVHVFRPEEYFIQDEPYYQPVGDEIAVFEAALALACPHCGADMRFRSSHS
jgi:nitric oxide reductase NorQ protein